MKRRIIAVFFMFLLAAVTSLSLAQDMEPVRGGTLHAAWQSAWESLDPHVASSRVDLPDPQ